MAQQLIDVLLSLRNPTVATCIIVAGLYVFAIYGFVTMHRTQQAMWRDLAARRHNDR